MASGTTISMEARLNDACSYTGIKQKCSCMLSLSESHSYEGYEFFQSSPSVVHLQFKFIFRDGVKVAYISLLHSPLYTGDPLPIT